VREELSSILATRRPLKAEEELDEVVLAAVWVVLGASACMATISATGFANRNWRLVTFPSGVGAATV